MNEKRLEILKNSIQRVKEDNIRIAEQNKKRAEELGEPIISPLIVKRFYDVIDGVFDTSK